MQTVGFGSSSSNAALAPMLHGLPSGSTDGGGEEIDTEALLAGQKPRRKWLKMERVPGQVELYKALEKALKELRVKHFDFFFFCFVSSSLSLLCRTTSSIQRRSWSRFEKIVASFICRLSDSPRCKVRAQDAPDYYNIITRPMHLAEIQRKLSLNMYYSKADFEADLNLIWANCRKFVVLFVGGSFLFLIPFFCKIQHGSRLCFRGARKRDGEEAAASDEKSARN